VLLSHRFLRVLAMKHCAIERSASILWNVLRAAIMCPPTGVGAIATSGVHCKPFGLSWSSSVPAHTRENKIQYLLDVEPWEKVQRFLPKPSIAMRRPTKVTLV
jgi:hypothetical protein